jgi:hypothetical protein
MSKPSLSKASSHISASRPAANAAVGPEGDITTYSGEGRPLVGGLSQNRLSRPLYQFEGNALRTLEKAQLSADVVHFVAQHGYAVGHEVRGGCLDIVDAEGEVIEAPLSQIRRVRPRISPRGRVELKQLDLEMRIRSIYSRG